MTDTDKLNFILRAIVTAGGPDKDAKQSDEGFLLQVAGWLLGVKHEKPACDRDCGCQKP